MSAAEQIVVVRAQIHVTAAGNVNETDAAAYLGQKPRTLRDWRNKGKAPPHFFLERRPWYPLKDLEEFLESFKRDAEVGNE
jgi:hypothetical protein